MEIIQEFPVARKKQTFRTNKIREALWGYLFITPNFLIVLIFTIFPVFFSFYMSMTDWNILSQPNFIGMANYQKLLTDQVARVTLFNTFYFTMISVPINVILTLVLAVLLNQKLRGISFYRTAYYMPVITASVAVSLMFMWILASNGLLNQLLGSVGLKPVKWLTDAKIALNSVIGVTIWKGLGMNMIIFLAALQDIPNELLEAASIDGANRFQQFTRIIVPLISPVIFFVTITGVIGSFQSFDLVYNMTGGGPGHATTVIGYYIWQQAFKYLHMGYGAALAYVVFIAILILTLIQWVLRKRWVYSEE
ncbi:ABC-type sugar transport system, permease component [Longilinea arvoryzae]|uniref:ABC-type sugar transport system, permease component n=2 Tax=Longilinea arvoryzae TaxID=360412 RepID=A0A0S7BHB8_9CHLR|nr:ABC-type sugar transport system, permease component [Longilinea arvoryzae]